MDADEFRELLRAKSDKQLLGICLRDSQVPYVFEPNPPAWDNFRDEVASRLGVSQGDIRIVGSGRLGVSLKPYKNLAKFTDISDIDVVIVNAEAFDELWIALLKAAYPRREASAKLGGWLKERKNEVYTGWITPQQIRIDASIFGNRAERVLELRTRWFSTLKAASKHPPRGHEDITGRLYRSWQHADLYHLDSLAALRKSLS